MEECSNPYVKCITGWKIGLCMMLSGTLSCMIGEAYKKPIAEFDMGPSLQTWYERETASREHIDGHVMRRILRNPSRYLVQYPERLATILCVNELSRKPDPFFSLSSQQEVTVDNEAIKSISVAAVNIIATSAS